ncbi:MAG: ABC transporter ATP-binding protein [Lachnospiraceae bacterium]|nr:ABC transporter ATP-binding protein [Lachnospiraceae bacterium]
MGNAIEVKHVSKSFKLYLDKGKQIKDRLLFLKRNRYEKREVLKDVSFEIPCGQTVGLIGVNGCGKSTTLKMLTRILYPDSGEIVINGRVSSLLELGAGFHPDMSGRENIYINAAIFGLKRSEIDRRLQDIIDFSELGDYIDNPVRTYSSGMYMRLAFSVAISVDADILLMDEVLAVGDINFQMKCLQRLDEIKQQGKTIVIVSHDAATISKFCDRAIWLRDGRIEKDGDAESVVKDYLHFLQEKRSDTTMEEGTERRRFGSFEVTLRELQIYRIPPELKHDLTESGERTGTVYPGDAVRFDIRYNGEHHRPGVAYGFHFKIETENGDVFVERDSFADGRTVVDPGPDEVIRFRFPELNLPCGRYHIYFAILDADGGVAECYTHYRNMVVAYPDGSNDGHVPSEGFWTEPETVGD